MTTLAHYALLSAAVLVALNLAAVALLVWRWWAEESYAREADARREPERARMDAAMARPVGRQREGGGGVSDYLLRRAADAIRFDCTDPEGPWSGLPKSVSLAVADLLDSVAGHVDREAVMAAGRLHRDALAVARAYLGRES